MHSSMLKFMHLNRIILIYLCSFVVVPPVAITLSLILSTALSQSLVASQVFHVMALLSPLFISNIYVVLIVVVVASMTTILV